MTPEGYYNPVTAIYYYYLKDHLGNNRVTYHYSGSVPVIDQEVEYYPFGSMFVANNLQNNLYLYNGKELNNEFFENYDFGARFYDAQIGRFHTVDPLAEQAYNWSPYRYGFDNPISTTDPSGMLEEWVDKKGKGQWEWDEEVKSEAAAKEKYGKNARYAESGYTYNTSDGSQIVLQDKGNWSYTSQKIDPDCPTYGLNNGNTGWVEQFQAGIKSYMPLLKASEIGLEVSATLLAGQIGATGIAAKGFTRGVESAITAVDDVAKAPLENFVSSYSRAVPEVLRAPSGGIRVGGKFYEGGQFIPRPRLQFGRGIDNFSTLPPFSTPLKPSPINYNASPILRYGIGIGGAALGYIYYREKTVNSGK